MKLYRIIVLHGAPKDSHTSTETYLVAESDKRVANWIQTHKRYGEWLDDSPYEEPRTRYDDEKDREISFREWVMLNRGDLSDDEGWEDAYYGVTKWGWVEVAPVTPADIERLIDLGIAVLDENKS